MNKKQLSLQNSSLFAELERRAKESEILNIRLDESEQKVSELTAENQQLKNGLIATNNEIGKLNGQIETIKAEYEEQIAQLNKELEAAKEEAKTAIIPETPTYNKAPIFEENISDNIDNLSPIADEIPTEEPVAEEPVMAETIAEGFSAAEPGIEDEILEDTALDSSSTEPVIAEESISEEAPTNEPDEKDEEPLAPTISTPDAPDDASTSKISLTDPALITDLLRDHGAKIIGKVTRVTAEVISKINVVDDDAAAGLKTLALGKNESFKFKVMELAKKGGDPDRVMAEMDFLADEAIIYLRSI